MGCCKQQNDKEKKEKGTCDTSACKDNGTCKSNGDTRSKNGDCEKDTCKEKCDKKD